jgi:hypothetical protein
MMLGTGQSRVLGGVYPRDEADRLVDRVAELAAKKNFPLKCTIEPAPDVPIIDQATTVARYAGAALSSSGSPIVVAQAKPQPTEADKKKLSEEIQKRYKPGPGSKSTLPSGTTRMDSGTASSCGGTGQIAACSAACSASCIFSCFPPNTPWGSGCHSCVNTCMDKCTGCGSGTSQ